MGEVGGCPLNIEQCTGLFRYICSLYICYKLSQMNKPSACQLRLLLTHAVFM